MVSWIDSYFCLFGLMFICLIWMLIVLFIFIMLVVGVMVMGDLKKFGLFGVKILFFYFGMILVVNIIGLSVGIVLKFGEGVSFVGVELVFDVAVFEFELIIDCLFVVIFENLVVVLVDGDVFVIIFFLFFLGVVILVIGKVGCFVGDFFNFVLEVVFKIIYWVMELVLFGVFGFVVYIIVS